MLNTTNKNSQLSAQAKEKSGEGQKVVVLLGPEEQPILDQVQNVVMRTNGNSHAGFVDPATCKPSITVDGLTVFPSITSAQRAYPNPNFFYDELMRFPALEFFVSSGQPGPAAPDQQGDD